MQWPNGKQFAFTIFDDTDNSTVANVKPVYDLLHELNFRTTKSVWVYQPRGHYKGQALVDPPYLEWVRQLQAQGFEIGFHNVGDGEFSRAEILAGLELFKELLGHYPRIHANHANNLDNIYWMKDRFDWPINVLYDWYYRLFKKRRPISHGSTPDSPRFWGDACKRHIEYIRNYTCRDIDTLRFNPTMPYIDARKVEFSNRWFSSSDGHTVQEFCDLLRPEAIAKLQDQGGACIAYTHLASGFVDAQGRVDPGVRARLEHLASCNGYFEPTSAILDHLRSQKGEAFVHRPPSTARWLIDRIAKKLRYGH